MLQAITIADIKKEKKDNNKITTTKGISACI